MRRADSALKAVPELEDKTPSGPVSSACDQTRWRFEHVDGNLSSGKLPARGESGYKQMQRQVSPPESHVIWGAIKQRHSSSAQSVSVPRRENSQSRCLLKGCAC